MKKIFTSLLVATIILVNGIGGVFASTYDTSKLDRAYAKIAEYYQTHKTLTSPDEIIAVESLGLEAEDGYELPDLESQDFDSISLGDLTKSIIALTLIGKDPTNIKDKNLITLLESYINADGSIKGSYGSTTDIWVLYALEAVSSDKISLVASHLANDANTDGGYWYEYNGKISSPDTTGWAIEVLSIADKKAYTQSIQKAIQYIDTEKKEDGSYGISPSGDTQACILGGLFVYDKAFTLSNYGEAIDVLLLFQLDDGSFKSAVYDENYNATGEYAFNAYTTIEAARCLGTYKNGSFVYKAQKTYQDLKNPVQNPSKEEKPTPTKPIVTPQEPAKENIKSKVVETSDQTNIYMMIIMMGMTSFVFVLTKKYEKNN